MTALNRSNVLPFRRSHVCLFPFLMLISVSVLGADKRLISSEQLLEGMNISLETDALIEALSHENPIVSKSAVTVLAQRGGREVVDALERRVANQSGGLRTAMGIALAKLGSETGLEVLREALRSGDQAIRIEAANGLCRFGGSKEDTVSARETLKEHVSQKDRRNRLSTIEVIGSCFSREERIQLLTPLLEDGDRYISGAAAEQLRMMKDCRVVPLFVELLEDEDPTLRYIANRGLEELSNTTVHYFHTDDPAKRERAIERWQMWWQEEKCDGEPGQNVEDGNRSDRNG